MKRERPVVAIQSCTDYTPALVDAAVRQIWEQSAMPSLSGMKVLVKPNILSDSHPSTGVCTHHEVVSSVLRLLLDGGARPIVGDSPAVHTSSFTGKISGIRDACIRLGVPWADFLSDTVRVSSSIRGRRSRSYPVTRHAAECDLIISVPKMKTHQLMYMTGAVKNLFGVIPAFTKSPFHLRHPHRRNFGEFLAHLYSALPPVVSVMDSILAMEGPGPNNGYPRHAGIMLASRDASALDTAASAVMGYNPGDITSCTSMYRLGLTDAKTLDDIIFPLLHPDDVSIPDFITIQPQNHSRVIWGMLSSRLSGKFKKRSGLPIIIEERCISCGKCAMICPNASASRQPDGTYRIHSRTCIRCFCCHEVCPADAITIGR